MMHAKKSLLEYRWVQEVFIFLALFVLITLNAGHRIENPWDFARDSAYFLILYAHAQLHALVLLPYVFRRSKVVYAVAACLTIPLFSYLLYLADFYWIYYWVQPAKINKLQMYFYHTGTCCLSLIAMLAPITLFRFYSEQKKQAGMQLAINQMQLKSLYAQLNPHFLFNTFNNLYGISLNDPARVPDVVMQVSKLMRYQVQNASAELVGLEDELAFIESYIELEEERVGERCDIRYAYQNDTPGIEYQLPPLLLIAFIENAFKHGTNAIAGGFVDTNILIKDGRLTLTVVNSVQPVKGGVGTSTGTGIKNTVQRLDILYKGQYSLETDPSTEKYSVRLILPLTLSKNAQ